MLSGWKGIAAYLNREERTAMRWAAERGLPVHRLPGRGRGSVYALGEEIDAWLAADRERLATARAADETLTAPPARGWLIRGGWWRKWRHITLIAGGVLVIAIGAFTLRARPTFEPAEERLAFTDPSARASYLQATYDWNLRTHDSLERAIQEYGDAIARDPRVAASYVGLANGYLLLPENGSMPEADAYMRAEGAARAAIDLAPRSAGAHRVLAYLAFWWRQDRPLARREFSQAVALGSDDALTHHWFATALSANGEHAAALREIGRARDLDPTETSVLADEALIDYRAGQQATGVALLRRLEREQPNTVSPHWTLSMIALLQGQPAEYLEEAMTTARLRGDRAAVDALARLRPISGRYDILIAALLRQAKVAVGPKDGWFRVAQMASLAGQRDLATTALTRSCAAHEPDAIGARGDPWLSKSLDQTRIAALCGEDMLE